jgi:hypothetical protein
VNLCWMTQQVLEESIRARGKLFICLSIYTWLIFGLRLIWDTLLILLMHPMFGILLGHFICQDEEYIPSKWGNHSPTTQHHITDDTNPMYYFQQWHFLIALSFSCSSHRCNYLANFFHFCLGWIPVITQNIKMVTYTQCLGINSTSSSTKITN